LVLVVIGLALVNNKDDKLSTAGWAIAGAGGATILFCLGLYYKPHTFARRGAEGLVGYIQRQPYRRVAQQTGEDGVELVGQNRNDSATEN
jgi:hypothetical protein